MGVRDRLEEGRRGAENRRQSIQDDLDELAAREFTGQDPDGCVRVTVDGLGAVRGVRVDPKQLRTIQRDELGRMVVEATRAARSASAGGMADTLERWSGGNADMLERLRDSLGYGRP